MDIALYVVATTIGVGLGYALAVRLFQRNARLCAADLVKTTELRQHNFTLAVDERIKETLQAAVRDGIAAEMGGLRRMADERMGTIEVSLKNALGLAVSDRAEARQDREHLKLVKEEMRAEVMAMRKALEQVAQAIKGLNEVTSRLEKAWTE